MSDSTIAIQDISVGMFLKYITKVNGITVSYVGEVICIDNDAESFEMLTQSGEMGFVLKEPENVENFSSFPDKKDNIHEQFILDVVKTKPKGWAKFKKDPHGYMEQIKKDNAPPPIKTKKQLIFDLVNNNKRKKLPALLKLAKKEIGGSDNSLTTLIQLALIKRK